MTTVSNYNILRWFARLRAEGLHLLYNVHALYNVTKDNVSAIQPRGLNSGDEELRPVGVGPSIGHGEDSGSSVLQDEVLVGELLTIDGLATSAIVVREIAALQHEVGDHAVEGGAFVTEALLASAQRSKVLASFGSDIISKL